MRRIFPVMILLGILPAVAGEVGSGPSILTNSPFLPPGFQPPGGAGSTAAEATASGGQFEFQGVYQLEGVYYFNLYNTREKKGNWISKEHPVEGLPRIIRYDQENDSLLVEVSGEQVNLAMSETSDKPLPIAGAVRTNIQPTTRTTTTSGVAPRPTPPRRRIIRPTTRTPQSPDNRRPVLPQNTPQQ